MVFAWKKCAKSSQTVKTTALKEHSKNTSNPNKQFEFGKKSAVEFLDETKAFYVKSKSVRDHKQILPIRPISSSHSFSVRGHNHNHNPLPPTGFNYFHLEASPAKSLPSAKINRRSTPVNSDVLQVKLRQLINSETVRNGGADVARRSANSNSKLGADSENSDSSNDDVISPPSEYAAEAPSAFRLRTRSRTQPSIAPVHKSLPNLNCDTPVNFTATFKDSFDDSSGHFTQPSADGSAGSASASASMTTTSRAYQMTACCERSDESERKQPFKHLLKPQHQQRHSRDSGSSTQHSDSSLHNKFSNIGASSSSVEPKQLYESQHNANSSYNVKPISFMKCDEPHPCKLWSRSGLKNVPEKSTPSERIIDGSTKQKTGMIDKPKMTRLATSMAAVVTASAAAPTTVAIDSDINNVIATAEDWSKPILRSKSDIGDRYGHYRNWSTPPFVRGREARPKPSTYSRPSSPRDIHHFFKYLGMSKEMFDEVVGFGPDRDSVTAALDRSAKLANGSNGTCAMQRPLLNDRPARGASNDSSEMSSFASSANIRYCDLEERNFETVSIVERNARIIKWLCSCRKSQIALLNRNASLV